MPDNPLVPDFHHLISSMSASVVPRPVTINPAQWMYERLVQQIADFEKELNADEEIGGRLVAAPDEGVFHIEDISYWGPDMIMFLGTNLHGRPVQLIQHYSQLSVLLTALPIESNKQPRRIGFKLVAELKKEAEDDG